MRINYVKLGVCNDLVTIGADGGKDVFRTISYRPSLLTRKAELPLPAPWHSVGSHE